MSASWSRDGADLTRPTIVVKYKIALVIYSRFRLVCNFSTSLSHFAIAKMWFKILIKMMLKRSLKLLLGCQNNYFFNWITNLIIWNNNTHLESFLNKETSKERPYFTRFLVLQSTQVSGITNIHFLIELVPGNSTSFL